jgi:hypothetical protein
MQMSYLSASTSYPLFKEGDLQALSARDKWDLDIGPLDHPRRVQVERNEENFEHPTIHRNLQSLLRLEQGASLHVILDSLYNHELDYKYSYQHGYKG